MLNEHELQTIFKSLRETFSIIDNPEITLEANPDDVNLSTLETWKSVGVNRLSVGLQSFNEAELKWMNRAHNAQQSLQCLDDITAAGFTNFSVDLIYGSPLQSIDDLKKNIEIIAQRSVPHISCYALTVEPGTLLNKNINAKKAAPVDPEKQAEQFYFLVDMLLKEGYEQYEISSFCKPGFESKHNSSYWRGKPYYGFGPSAHSFNGFDKRRWNIANNAMYIQSLEKNIIPYEEETLTDTQRVNEYVMTALRTTEGINLMNVTKQYGEENRYRIIASAQKFIALHRLQILENNLSLTTEGKFFADGIAGDLFK